MQVGSVVVCAARRAHRGCALPASPRPAPTAGRWPSMAGCPHTPCARDGLWRGPASGKIEGNSNSNSNNNNSNNSSTSTSTEANRTHNASISSRATGSGETGSGRVVQSGFNVFPDRGNVGARCGRRGDAQSRPWMAGGRKWEQDGADSGWASPLRPRRAARSFPKRPCAPTGPPQLPEAPLRPHPAGAARKHQREHSPRLGEEPLFGRLSAARRRRGTPRLPPRPAASAAGWPMRAPWAARPSPKAGPGAACPAAAPPSRRRCRRR